MLQFLRPALPLARSCARPRPRPCPPPLCSLLIAPRAHLHASPRSLEQQLPQVPLNSTQGTPIGRVDRRLRITFTCTASLPPPADADTDAEHRTCGHRSSHEFSARSYEKGVVIVQCPGCDNRHLIADHLHWFSQTPSPASPLGQPIGAERPRTVEDLVREKGESVRWGALPGGGEDGSVKWVVREHEEGDGGKTVEVLPDADVGAAEEGEPLRRE